MEGLTDFIWDGKSTIEDFTYNSKKFTFKYILKKSSYEYPNVFIIFWLDKIRPYVNLSDCTYITIRIKEATKQDITLFIKTYEEGASKLGHRYAETLRHNSRILSLSPTLYEYRININEFATPEWWYEEKVKKSRNEIGRETYKKVVSFDMHFIHNSNTPLKEELNSLVVEEIAFHKPLKLSSIILAGILISYYCIFLLFFLSGRKKRKKFLPEYNQLSIVNYRDRELERIREYIKEHYNDPQISTIKLQEEIGISSTRVYSLIKEKYNLSFKQLINKIRIEEAKRLLRESDLRIIEISYEIGFNDSTYFCKLFKQIEGISPSGYREKVKQGKSDG
ncbi:MAG: helix-turn-helix transcriptional regulator [Spirochaetales bacterium]|nr:helix-turn-helix transcriptional regulator [Spirochaetales bacterium]